MQLITTTTSDKLRLHGFLSEASESKKIIIHIHGMAGDMYLNSFYPHMYADYPKAGWSFLAAEHRGTHSITEFVKDGKYVNIGNAYEKFEECV